MGLGMAKSKQKPGNRAAAAKTHSKSSARVAGGAARKAAKPAAKAKPAPAVKKKPVEEGKAALMHGKLTCAARQTL